MPRRSILSAAERDSLLAWPDTQEKLIRHYTLSEIDISIIRQHRGTANRLGYAVQLCTMRYPGIMLRRKEGSKMTLLAWLRQSPAKPNSGHMLEHIERLRALEALGLASALNGRFIKTVCSRSPARVVR